MEVGVVQTETETAQFVNILKSGPEAKRSTGNSTMQTAANNIKGHSKKNSKTRYSRPEWWDRSFHMSALEKSNTGWLGSTILLEEVSFRALFPACLLSLNVGSTPWEFWSFTMLYQINAKMVLGSLIFMIRTQQKKQENKPQTLHAHSVPLGLFLATYLTKPVPIIQHTALSHCVWCALFLSPQNAIHHIKYVR